MHTPSNAIIAFVGFLLAFGAVGGIEQAGNDIMLIPLMAIAFAGLGLMYAGVNGLTHSK